MSEEIKQLLTTFNPLDACVKMGIHWATERTARIYIKNMDEAGMFLSSYKLNRLWCITLEDIERVKKKIMEGSYVPSAKQLKKAA